MSAIWGAISLNGNKISKEEIEGLKKPIEKCVIDRVEEIEGPNYYMGCGIQYFTKEARSEQLPYRQKEQPIVLDADVILDNREELIQTLNMKEGKDLPDGTLLYHMIARYGKGCLNDLLGAYAFVSYDSKRNEVSMVIDAVGSRCVYYTLQDGVIYYSSLISSLLNVMKHRKINGSWASDFLIADNLSMFSDSETTPVEDIYRVAPAQIVTITKTGLQKETYWKPAENRKEIHYDTDEEYKNYFLSIYSKAVSCLLRSENETSIMLSGGLDSTSVACLAAPMLKKEGKTLQSYTSVPMKGYKSDNSGYWVPDESHDVIKTKEYLGNLDCKFIDLTEVDVWKERNDQLEALEFPYKAVENVYWMEEVMKQSYENGARIMLTGVHGNVTISYSNFDLYLERLLCKGHFCSFIKQFQIFWKKYGFSRKKELKGYIKNWLFNKRNSGLGYDEAFVKESAIKQYGAIGRLNKLEQACQRASKNYYDDRIMISRTTILRQIGEFETKFSLMTGTILRDPTRDKRILELCVNFPLEQFVKNGEERRLISVYMRDIMPQHVFNERHRGLQSADLVHRLMNDWKKIKETWMSIYQDNMDNEYVDCKKAMEQLEACKTGAELSQFDAIRQMYTLLWLEYEKQFTTVWCAGNEK